MENHHGFVMEATVTPALTDPKRRWLCLSFELAEKTPGWSYDSEVDRGCDTKSFVAGLCHLSIISHMAHKHRYSAIDGCITGWDGY